MTPPTPAAVRAAMNDMSEPLAPDEREALIDDGRLDSSILRDHIRAVCAEMRERAVQAETAASAVSTIGAEMLHNYANDLRVFADQLEGRRP